MYQTNSRNASLLSIGIILIVGSWILGFALGFPLKDLLAKPDHAFMLGQTNETHYILIASFILLGISFIIFSIERLQLKKKLTIGIIGILLSIAVFYIGYDSYYYGSEEKGFTYNPLTSLGAQHYAWSDIELFEEIYTSVNGGSQERTSVIFHIKDGEKIELSYYPPIFENRRLIEAYILAAGGQSKVTILDNN